MLQSTELSLVQVMACRLFGAKPSPEPMQAYCQLDSWKHNSVKFESDFYLVCSRKCNCKRRLPKWRPFCTEWDELTQTNLIVATCFSSMAIECDILLSANVLPYMLNIYECEKPVAPFHSPKYMTIYIYLNIVSPITTNICICVCAQHDSTYVR